MSSRCHYGPPLDSDSDSSYDGFYFSNDRKRVKPAPYVDPEQKLYNAAVDGDLPIVQEEMRRLGFHVDQNVRGGPNLLMIACCEGHYEMVKWLVEEGKANVNRQLDSLMPLMAACDCSHKDPYVAEKIVRLLLLHGAAVNVSDKYGMTPFMSACQNGFIGVVRLMIKDVSFDAVDNQGCTPIFHAIEKNHVEVVKLLVEAGVNATIANNKGYTPTQVAECHGYYDLLEILPRPAFTYSVPVHFLGYNTLRDHIPRIFLKSDCPEYFQELNGILQSINAGNMVQHFAIARTSLAEFLVMDEQSLRDVGIEYPIYRNKILKGILDFHLHHWSNKSIARVKQDGMDNFYEILMIAANHLQQLIIIQASLRFILKNQQKEKLGQTSEMQLASIKSNLQGYRDVLNQVTKTVKYLGSFSPSQNPLFIDFNEILAERKRKKVRNYFKYTTIILGISVFICLKCKWFS
ncbi:ankyrin repeat domain-containing protein 27 [Drosophila ficusphila]|uniref:ankyrin repeat domain-containing protein 27 n=1 Tax=Drosophila ficusphila TaxID=30025 RepID=UPI0007E85ADE|nr:ankyrin repeat domain-containing protein 27 [Drosophila ficusphila]